MNTRGSPQATMQAMTTAAVQKATGTQKKFDEAIESTSRVT